MKCSRCGKNEEEVMALVKLTDEVCICSQCITKLSNKIKATKTKTKNEKTIPSTHDMVAYLNDYIIGQDEAKQTLSIAIRNHFKRISMDDETKKNVSKSNVMIIGGSGTGKTELVKRLADYVELPMVVVDANSYTSSGYTGEDVESMVAKLYYASGEDKNATENGIIFIDEIDKKRNESTQTTTKDIGGGEVQKSLLKIVEGRDVHISNSVTINTTNILFISAGAFVGLNKIVASRQTDTSVGFLTPHARENFVEGVTNEDLFKFGMIPEFIGRFPIVTYTKDLTEDELFKIVTESKTSIYRQYQTLFSVDDVELEVTDDVIRHIINKVNKEKVGVRGLHKHFDDLLKVHQFNLECYKGDNIKKVVATIDSDSNIKFELKKQRKSRTITK